MSILGSKSTEPTKIGPEIIEHWYSLVIGQNFPVSEFYDAVREEIEAQQLPNLEIKEVKLSEGGFLSDKRVYLRMRRERLYFDVCAAPIGVNFFFSYRFYSVPVTVSIGAVLIVMVLAGVIGSLLVTQFGLFAGLLLLLLLGTLGVAAMRNAAATPGGDADAVFMDVPLLGPIYERYFRKDTYYRQDTRIAYCSIVSAIVKAKAEAITSAKGVWLRRELLYSPVFDGLYHARSVETGAPAAVS